MYTVRPLPVLKKKKKVGAKQLVVYKSRVPLAAESQNVPSVLARRVTCERYPDSTSAYKLKLDVCEPLVGLMV